MGLIEKLLGTKVCLDTAPLIYFIEKLPPYFPLVQPVFAEIAKRRIEAITSGITLLEVLVQPYSQEIERTSELVAKLSLESDRTLSRVFVSEQRWREDETMFFLNLREEAVPA